MDFNEYLAERLVKERLHEARALAARRALIDSLRPPRRPLRVVVGFAMVRAGHWVLGHAPECAGEPGALS
jgi:hypothetical protein